MPEYHDLTSERILGLHICHCSWGFQLWGTSRTSADRAPDRTAPNQVQRGRFQHQDVSIPGHHHSKREGRPCERSERDQEMTGRRETSQGHYLYQDVLIDYLNECAHAQAVEIFMEGERVKHDAQAEVQLTPEAQCLQC